MDLDGVGFIGDWMGPTLDGVVLELAAMDQGLFGWVWWMRRHCIACVGRAIGVGRYGLGFLGRLLVGGGGYLQYSLTDSKVIVMSHDSCVKDIGG